MDTVTGLTKLDLYLELDERPEGLIARFVYSSELFDATTIDRMVGHWLTLLQSAVKDPSSRLCDLQMLTPAEDRQLRNTWNETRRAIPETTVHRLIEDQARRSPNAIAVEAGAVRLTYGEVNERANRLARRLRAAGVKPGTLVALCVERTVNLVIAPLAVMKAGGAYLPLDYNFPKDRLAYLVEDAQAPVFLTERSLMKKLPSTKAEIICCDEQGRVKVKSTTQVILKLTLRQSIWLM